VATRFGQLVGIVRHREEAPDSEAGLDTYTGLGRHGDARGPDPHSGPPTAQDGFSGLPPFRPEVTGLAAAGATTPPGPGRSADSDGSDPVFSTDGLSAGHCWQGRGAVSPGATLSGHTYARTGPHDDGDPSSHAALDPGPGDNMSFATGASGGASATGSASASASATGSASLRPWPSGSRTPLARPSPLAAGGRSSSSDITSGVCW
jgi:hypothetical protein